MIAQVDWTGKSLAEDLAKTKDRSNWMTWVQIPLGSVMWSNAPRADVLAVRKSFFNPSFTIYEVKVSRSDFNADVNKGKYRSYFADCCQFYFAVPTGLVKKEEVPEGTGLIVRGENSWHVVKAAPRREFTPTVEMLLKLLMRGYEDQLVAWKQYDRIKNLEYKGLKEASYQFGIKVAQDLGQAEELIRLAEQLKNRVGEALGKEYKTVWEAVFALEGDVERLLGQKRYATEANELSEIVRRLCEGTRFFANNTPEALRKIADRLEAKFNAEERELKGERGSGRKTKAMPR